MDAEEYRRRTLEELERAAAKRSRYRDVLDASKPAAERRSAAEASGGPADAAEVEQTLGLVLDRGEDVAVRVAALRAIGGEVSRRPDLIDAALGLLRDRSAPAELRRAALRVLQQSSFRAAIFNPKRPDYLETLRALLDDEDAELRRQALAILAKEKDEYAQRRLLEGLSRPAEALVPPEKAVQLLGYDVHAEHAPLLREMVRNPPNTVAKREAVRLLGADPEAKELLLEVFRNKGEDREVRKASAASLQSLAPAEFETHAQEVALDPGDDAAVRAASLNALEHFGDPATSGRGSEFYERVKAIGEEGAPEGLARALESYVGKREG